MTYKPKNTGLGRGLDAIFLDNTVESSGVTMLRTSDIEPNPDQPRKKFDETELASLADSIAANGLIEPIVVRSSPSEGMYQIIAGERRWRASMLAGLSEIPVRVMELDDKKAAQIALIENVQREDLNAVEEASAYETLVKRFNMTHDEIAAQIGKSRAAVTNSIRLLDLPDDVKTMISDGTLSAGHGRALLGLNDKNDVSGLAELVKSERLSVRETEKAVRKANSGRKKNSPPENEKNSDGSPDYTSLLADKMTSRLGKKVVILRNPKTGAGKIEIVFSDDDGLDELVTSLCGSNIFDE